MLQEFCKPVVRVHLALVLGLSTFDCIDTSIKKNKPSLHDKLCEKLVYFSYSILLGFSSFFYLSIWL
jgi:hypothetical protein